MSTLRVEHPDRGRAFVVVAALLAGLLLFPGAAVAARAAPQNPCFDLPCSRIPGGYKILLPRPGVTFRLPDPLPHRTMSLPGWLILRSHPPGDTGRSTAYVQGNLVLTKEELRPTMKLLKGRKVTITAHHRYLSIRDPAIWSLHFQQSGPTAALREVVEDLVRALRPPPRTNGSYRRSDSATRRALRRHVNADVELTGDYLHLSVPDDHHAHASVSGPAPISEIIFHRGDTDWFVAGDLVVKPEEIGVVYRVLFDSRTMVTALAYDSTRPRKRRYFIHFMGVGPIETLLERLERLSRRTSLELGRAR